MKKENQKTLDLIDEIAGALKEADEQIKAKAIMVRSPATVVPTDRPLTPISPRTTPSIPVSLHATAMTDTVIPRLITDVGPTHAGPTRPVFPSPLLSIPGYRLIREIGRGGQAAVYEAIQLSTSRKVAVKVLRDGPISSPMDNARFDREIHILASLNHPNIIHVIDRGKTRNGGLFLVMAYIQGITFDAWLADFRAQNAARRKSDQVIILLKLFLKILDAVNAAHLRGVIHRDLKPSNILVDERGEPHILDFGLARTAVVGMTDGTPDVVSATGQFIGSIPWASPEQARGIHSSIDMRTDVYSLGVMLYHMLSGHFPYEVTGEMPDVLNNIVNRVPDPPSKREPRSKPHPGNPEPKVTPVSGSFLHDSSFQILDAIVLKALAKRHEDRYLSAGEMARDITNFLSDRPTIAAGDTARWRRMSKVALIMLAMIGVGVGSFVLGHIGSRFFSDLGTLSIANGYEAPLRRPDPAAPSSADRHLPLPSTLPSPSISIGIASERTKLLWLKQAIEAFNKTPEGKSVEVRIIPLSGVASVRAVTDGDQRINIMTPSNSFCIDAFVEHWKSLYGRTPILRSERLALSPMVFLFSSASHDAFVHAHPKVTFKEIHDAIAPRATSAAQPPSFRFGYVNPTESLDGAASLILMNYEFAAKTRDMTMDNARDPAFKAFLEPFAMDRSRISSNPVALTQDMVLMGTNRYDCVMVPENAVILHMQQGVTLGSICVAYPEHTLWNDHPAYVLDVPWSGEAQKKAASALVDFLLTDSAQAMALSAGLRPIDPAVPIASPDSPFVRFSALGLQPKVADSCEPPSAMVVQSLQAAWIQSRPSPDPQPRSNSASASSDESMP